MNNPKGRTPQKTALGEAIRRGVDPRELVQMALSIARGQGVRMTVATGADGQPVTVEAAPPTYKERIQAMKLLFDFGYTKPAVQVELAPQATGEVDFSRLTPAQLDDYGKLLAVAAGEDPEKLVPARPTVSFAQLEAAAIDAGEEEP